MSDNWEEQLIDFLASIPDGLDQLLQCSPYEERKRLSRRMTEEFFFDHLFFGDSDVFRDYADKLRGRLSGGGKILSLEGHSGVGKTTFVRSFMRNRDNADTFTFDYIDCSKIEAGVSRSPLDATDIRNLDLMIESASSEEMKARLAVTKKKLVSEIVRTEKGNTFTRIFRKYIKNKLTEGLSSSFLYFLSRHRGALSEYFVSDDIKARLSSLADDIGDRRRVANAWENILKELQTNDSFLLLLTLVEYIRCNNSETNKPEVIIFDNLDAIGVPLLHKDFIKLFYETPEAFGAICEAINRQQPELGFAADHNFVFVIRDANNSSISEHAIDNLGVERIHFSCDPAFYRNIIAKRLEYYLHKVELPLGRDEVSRNIIALFNFIADQPFYTEVLIPAFNMDYRRLTKALYEVIENFVPDVPPAKASEQRVDWSRAFDITFPELAPPRINSFSIPGEIARTYLDYKAELPDEELEGFYGALLHGVIAKLHSVEFYDAESWSKHGGYCLASRMLLTLILNASGVGRSGEFIIQNNRYAEVPLTYIMEEAQDLYSKKEILTTLVGLYRVANSDQMTYLVSFRQREVHHQDAYEDLDKILKDSTRWAYLLDNASVVITQAGFIFLRNLLVHYEFYSYLVYHSFQKNRPKRGRRPMTLPKPLFVYKGERVGDEEGQFDFESSLSATFHLVKMHSLLMYKFYLSKFKEKGEDYLKSQFVFKHIGGFATDEGLFHITRIVARHVEYIDEYRRWLLKRSEGRSTDARRAVNNRLLKAIEDYVELFDDWGDKDSMMEPYAETVLKNVRAIKEDFNSWPLPVAPLKLK